MIEQVKELLKDDTTVQERMLLEEKNDKDLIKYINHQARNHLNNKNGGISDDIVKGWAIHYYVESKDIIDKEMKIKKVVPEKELTPEEQSLIDKKDKEKELKKAELANKKAKDRKIKLASLEKEKAKLDITDPFRNHVVDFKTLTIISTVPKKENQDQMGLFDL